MRPDFNRLIFKPYLYNIIKNEWRANEINIRNQII
nr:MAG TPA: hypothetical protein [Caudoviricetes sp.]